MRDNEPILNARYPLYTQGTLDAQSEAILEQIAEAKAPPLFSRKPQEARQDPFEASWIGTADQDVRTETLNIPGAGGNIPVRVYTPAGQPPYPLLVFFHGGGFVVGTLDEFDPFCTFLAKGASCIVASVGYRLAPEHKHPAALEDAVAAVNWVAAHARDLDGDPTRVAVAGDSSGGNLATVTALIARDQGFPHICYQVLVCPWVDSSCFETDSFRYFGEGLWLSKTSMDWYRNHYLQNEAQAMHPFVSPLLANDLYDLPPALVITAEFDVLRDQGRAYAQRLEAAGIPVKYTQFPGMLHDFVIFPGLFNRAKAAIDEICIALQEAYKR